MGGYFPKSLKGSAIFALAIMLAFLSEQEAWARCGFTGTGYNARCPNGTSPIFDGGNFICDGYQCILSSGCSCSSGRTPVAYVEENGEVYGCVDNPASIVVIYSCDSYTAAAKNADTKATTAKVATAVTSSASTATDSMAKIAAEMPQTQAGAPKAAGDVALTGANSKANGALLFCAEGANRELDSAGSGIDDIAACQGDFKSADQLATMAAQNGRDATLKRDEGMLKDAVSVATLEKFQKNFGIDKDEYVNRMLASHGRSTEFADMLSAKFSAAQLDKLFSAAGEVQPAQTAEITASDNASGVTGAKSAKKETSLRDSLKAKLEAADANRKLASKEQGKTDYSSVKAPGEKLQPHGLEAWINGSEEQQEAFMSIFDVIHQKLQSLKQREQI